MENGGIGSGYRKCRAFNFATSARVHLALITDEGHGLRLYRRVYFKYRSTLDIFPAALARCGLASADAAFVET